MYRTMTWDEWYNHYKPITNKITPFALKSFETYGEEQDFVFAQPNENVWTEVDVDGGVYLVAGKHYVNRIHYYVTELPYDNEDQEVVVNFYKECKDCESWGGFGSNIDGTDCQTCNNEDYVAYPETHEELIELLGEEYANEQV